MVLTELQRIDEDLFDVAHRLREIDDRYILYRNRRLNRFEIYADRALQLVVPYDRLDARTVEFARSTRLEYADRVMRQIERDNEKLLQAQEKSAREKIIEEVEKTL